MLDYVALNWPFLASIRANHTIKNNNNEKETNFKRFLEKP